jgi:cellulose synthase/poly-beta-1,6-N-acetylglucosamine synthase-like glycosyltransferase
MMGATLSAAGQTRGAPIGATVKDLETRWRRLSPRVAVPPTPWVSHAISGATLVLWLLLLAAPFGLKGVFVWSAGLVYAAYDTVLLVFTFFETLTLLRPALPAPPELPRPTLAVLVAARNEAAVLPETLKALLAQAQPPEEIVVVDDGSDDATPEALLAAFGMAPPALGGLALGPGPLRWLRLPPGGKARAMNAALGRIASEVVVTVDADTRLESGAIAAMREAFARDPGLVAATGVITPVCAPTVLGRTLQWFQTYEYIRNFLSRYAWMRRDSLVLISGAFAGFRTAAVIEVGGFDPDCLVEDYELIHRLKRFGSNQHRSWRTAVVGGARAQTEAPSTPMAFLRQRRRWFGGFLQTQYWYRDMVGNRRYGELGLFHLPVKAADTVQPIYGLTAFGLLIWYLATGKIGVVFAISGVIGAKIALDLAFHLWSILLYRRWLGPGVSLSPFLALAAAVAEPFTFQLLRHTAAMWGWWTFLTGGQTWGRQSRAGALG